MLGKISTDAGKNESQASSPGRIVDHRSFGRKMYTTHTGHESSMAPTQEPAAIKFTNYENERRSVGLVM
jgi:hypothetical protein